MTVPLRAFGCAVLNPAIGVPVEEIPRGSPGEHMWLAVSHLMTLRSLDFVVS